MLSNSGHDENDKYTGGGKTSTFRVHTDGRIELLFSTGTVAVDSYHFITTSFLVD